MKRQRDAKSAEEFAYAKNTVFARRRCNQRLCFISHPGNRQSPCRRIDQRKRHCPRSQRRFGPESASLSLPEEVQPSAGVAPASPRLSVQLPLPALPLWFRHAVCRLPLRLSSPTSSLETTPLGLGLILVTGHED